MKMVKKTGLVPVYAGKDVNHIFGVTPDAAKEGVENKTLFLVEIPEGIETEEVPGMEIVEPEEFNSEGVVIPPDWDELHHMKKVKLAQSILGDEYKVPEGTKALDYAETAIREEIQRRADADGNPPAE